MKTNYILTLFLLSFLLLAGCSKEKDPMGAPNSDPTVTGNAYASTSYVLRWNKSNSTYEIHEVTFESSNHDATLTHVGSSSPGIMASKYDVKEINYDENSNQFVALHKYNGFLYVSDSYESLWVYDVASKSDKLIKLPEISEDYHYTDLVVVQGKALVLKWNGVNTSYEIHEVNLSNGSLQLVGASSTGTMSHPNDLYEIDFDKKNNRVLALRRDNYIRVKDIWVYDLTNKTERIVSLPTLPNNNHAYRDVHVSEDKIFILTWNGEATSNGIHELDLSNGSMTLVGTSSKYTVNSSSLLMEISFDRKNNRVLAVHGNSWLWYYDLTKKTDGVRHMPVINSDLSSYTDMVIHNKKLQ
jgi:hypothetical protein